MKNASPLHSNIQTFEHSNISPLHSNIRTFEHSNIKKGFSLVELIVVIGIIGVLAGVLMISFSGSSESARTAKCMTNMRNLAAACQTYGAVSQRYPLAGSIEWSWIDESAGFRNVKRRYDEHPGWISWHSEGVYNKNEKPTSHQASASWMTSMYCANDKEALYSLTNGTLWKYVSGNRDTYVCPMHAKKMHLSRAPIWSYLMNANFGWDYNQGSKATGDIRKYYGDLKNAEKVLLFAEVPYSNIGPWQPSDGGSGTDCDCVLQYKTSVTGSNGLKGDSRAKGSSDETIGVNHKSGKQLVAPVVFADGHTEKLVIPFTGNIKRPSIDGSMLTELTAWLCMGQDVSFDGKQYKKTEQ